jgi:hypothetical protein
VSGLKAIGMVFGLLWLIFIVGFGALMSEPGQRWAASGIADAADNQMTEETSETDARPQYSGEYERARRRERDGVDIDSGSARPMVDVDPRH